MANYRQMARRAAQRHGLDPGVFERQIQQESGFVEDVITGRRRSPAGAVGIAQIMPDTAKGWGVDPLDPRQALDVAAKNMASYVKKYGGYENALRAYNAGPGAIQKSRGYAETNNYVKTILGGKRPSVRGVSPSGGGGGTPGAPGFGLTTPKHLAFDPGTGQVPNVTLPQRPQLQVTAPSAPDLTKAATDAYETPQLPSSPASSRLDVGAALEALQTLQGARKGMTGGSTVNVKGTPATGGGNYPASGKKGSEVLELIFNNGGKGFGIKNGQAVDGPSAFSGVWGGHRTHVHVAAGPQTVVALGKLAQTMGLNVGENPHFGGVDPVHVPGSYHYKGEAIDVSGDPRKMGRFAKAVQRYNRTHRLPG
jgi:hypothetical protein